MITGEKLTAKAVAEAANKGDEKALEVYRVSGEYLGKRLSIIIDILNPEVIVIGSVYTRCEKLFADSMQKEIKSEVLSVSAKCCKILPAISLTSFTGLNTAFCNDVDPALVYAQPLMALGIKVISLTGESGGKLLSLSDICIKAPETETYKVQELHLPICHCLCAEVEKYFF